MDISERLRDASEGLARVPINPAAEARQRMADRESRRQRGRRRAVFGTVAAGVAIIAALPLFLIDGGSDEVTASGRVVPDETPASTETPRPPFDTTTTTGVVEELTGVDAAGRPWRVLESESGRGLCSEVDVAFIGCDGDGHIPIVEVDPATGRLVGDRLLPHAVLYGYWSPGADAVRLLLLGDDSIALDVVSSPSGRYWATPLPAELTQPATPASGVEAGTIEYLANGRVIHVAVVNSE